MFEFQWGAVNIGHIIDQYGVFFQRNGFTRYQLRDYFEPYYENLWTIRQYPPYRFAFCSPQLFTAVHLKKYDFATPAETCTELIINESFR